VVCNLGQRHGHLYTEGPLLSTPFMTILQTCRNALLTLATLCLGAVTAAAQSGTVKAEGQTLPGVTVRATQGNRILQTLTGDNGEFQFDGMSPGQWIVEADLFGFDHFRREVQVGTSPTKIDLTMQLRGRTAGQQAQRNQEQPPPETVENDQNNAAFGGSPEAAPQAAVQSSNESFLVNGTVSTGLQTNNNDFGPGGPGGPGGLGAQGFGPGGQNGFGDQNGQPGAGAQATAAGGGGRGGGGGGGGGRGGGGGFAGGGGGGGGGFGGGGRGGRGGGRGGPRQNQAFIGNRQRRGNNQIRVQFFYQVANSVANAAPFSLNGQQITNPSYAQNRIGLNIGGPFMIPKLFDLGSKVNFTINYSGNLQRGPFNSTTTVPTAAQRMGDFSGISNVIYQPGGNIPFPNNQIPLSMLSPIATGLENYIPLPNQNATQNLRILGSTPNNAQNLSVRFGFTLTRKDRLALQYNLQDRNSINEQTFGFRDQSQGMGNNTSLTWTHNFGSRMFNNLTGNFNRNTSSSLPYFANGLDVATYLGIDGTSPNPLNYGPPTLSFTNFGSLSDGNPVRTAVQNEGVSDAFSFNRGKHNISFGGGYTWYLNNTITDANGRGTFTFTGTATSELNQNLQPLPGTGWDFADFLLSLPTSNSVRFGSSSQYFRSNAYNLYTQDDWRVRNNLTINVGLRYEFFSPWHEKYGRMSNLDVGPGFTSVASVVAGGVGPYSGQFSDALINPDRTDFGPRLGISWKPKPNGKIVIRTGYGLYYNLGVYNKFSSQLAQQPPFAQSTTVNSSVGNVLTLATGLLASPPNKTITNSFAVDRFYRDAYAQTWTFYVQRDIPGSMVLEVGYQGTKGTHLDIQEIPNRAPPGSSPLSSYSNLSIANAVNFTYDLPVGNSIMNQGQVRLNRRFRRNMSFQVLYTRAKSIDDSSTFGGAGNTVAQNWLDLAAERGLSSFDRRNVLTGTYTLQSPVGVANGLLQNKPILEKALKDWTLSGNVTAETGTPLTARVLGNQSNVGGTGSIGSGRAEATGLPVDSGTGYFNLLAFTTVPLGQFGNAGRNTIPGPGLYSLNVSLSRNINLTERKRMEIRLDTTNVLNHPNITNFGTVVNSLTYGLPSSAGGMRTLSATIRFRF
jgi:hypothetical protein